MSNVSESTRRRLRPRQSSATPATTPGSNPNADLGQLARAATAAATPARRRTLPRASSLAPVGSQSFAYGTGAANLAQPMVGSRGINDVQNVLEGLIDSPASTVRQSRRGTTPVIASPSRGPRPVSAGTNTASFGNESSLFQGAGLESSSLLTETNDYDQPFDDDDGLQTISEEEEQTASSTGSAVHPRVQARNGPTNGSAANSNSGSNANGRPNSRVNDGINDQVPRNSSLDVAKVRLAEWFGRTCSAIDDMLTQIWAWIAGNVPIILKLMCMMAIALIPILLGLKYLRGPSITPSGSIGQYIPEFISHPTSLFRSNEVKELSKRVHTLEVDFVNFVRSQKPDHKTADFLEHHVSKDLLDRIEKYGREQGSKSVPMNLVFELNEQLYDVTKQRLLSDPDFMVKADLGNVTGPVTAEAFRELATHLTKTVSTMKAAAKDDRTKAAHEVRSEVLKMVQDDWDQLHKDIDNEQTIMQGQIQDALLRLTQIQGEKLDKATHEILVEKVNEYLQRSKLEAYINAKIKTYTRESAKRINYFSPSLGARIFPHATSPAYSLPSTPRGWFRSQLVKVWSFTVDPIPIPNPPITALTKWDEYGECWCSPLDQENRDANGATLGVHLNHTIYPNRIVVEHVAGSATLEPGSTPKQMELWALFGDDEAIEVVARASNAAMGIAYEVDIVDSAVRISSFKYEVYGAEIQAFPVLVDLKQLSEDHGVDTSVSKFIVKVKENWGEGRVPYTCLYRVRLHGDM